MRALAVVLAVILAFFLLRVGVMRLKHGVDLEGVSWRLFWAAIVADTIWKRFGAADGVTITSGVDGKHSSASLHYKGLALDFRIHDIKGMETYAIMELKKQLGASYDVVLESTHIHVEYDPK